MQDLGRMGVFAVVAGELSLSKAAEKLGTTKSAVSKQLTALEEELGVKLLNRSTRHNRLTDEGRTLYSKCQAILQRYYEVKDIAEQFKATPSGELSLEMPDGIATHYILPRLAEFQDQYPLITLKIIIRQAALSEITEELDVGIASGTLPDSSVICRRLGSQILRLYASPAYLRKFGTPGSTADIGNHHCIVMKNSSVPEAHKWIMHSKGEITTIHANTTMTVNDVVAAQRLVLGDAGISVLQDFAVAEHVKNGELIPVLPEYETPPVPIYAIFNERKQQSPKVRAMVDFLLGCFPESSDKIQPDRPS